MCGWVWTETEAAIGTTVKDCLYIHRTWRVSLQWIANQPRTGRANGPFCFSNQYKLVFNRGPLMMRHKECFTISWDAFSCQFKKKNNYFQLLRKTCGPSKKSWNLESNLTTVHQSDCKPLRVKSRTRYKHKRCGSADMARIWRTFFEKKDFKKCVAFLQQKKNVWGVRVCKQ